MTVRIKGHFDGKTIVRTNQSLAGGNPCDCRIRHGTESFCSAATLDERLSALAKDRVKSDTRCIDSRTMLFGRENMYGDEGR